MPIWISSTAKNPSIATTYNGTVNVHIAWEDPDPAFANAPHPYYCRSTDGGLHWGTPISVGDIGNNGLGGLSDATPIVGSGSTGTLAVVGWRYWGGIALLAEPAVNMNHAYYSVPNTDATSNHPSMDCFNGYRLAYGHSTSKIIYQEFTPSPTTYSITFPSSTDLTSGYSITSSANPTIATSSTTNAYVAWDGFNGTAHHIFTRQLTSSGWQSLVELSDGTRAESQPTIGVDLGLGKVYLLWQSDTHIAKVSSDVTNFGWSNVSDRGVGTAPAVAPSIPSGSQSLAMWITGSAAPYTINIPSVGASTMQSYTANVTGTNSQRKLVRGSNGYLYLTYESEGDIWFQKSTDNGSTWSSAAYLSRGSVNCAYPAITERNGSLYVVWQQAVGANYNIVYNYSTDGTGTTWLTNPITHTANVSTPSPGPIPAIIAGTPANSFELMLVFRRSTDLQSSRTTTTSPSAGSWTTITVNNTNSSSQNPSLAYVANSYGYFNLTWDQGYGGNVSNEIFFGSWWTSLTNISNAASGGGIYNHVSSSYALNGNSDRLIAWQGYHQSYSEQVIVFNKNLNPTVYTEFYNQYYHNYYSPTITGNNTGRANLLWYDATSTLWKTTYDGSNWSTPTNFGGSNNYPTTSVNNPPGGTAYSFWTTGTAAPYSIQTNSNGGPLQKASSNFTYARRVALFDKNGKARFSVQVTNPLLKTSDGTSMMLSFVQLNDSTVYDAQTAWNVLETGPYTSSGAVQTQLTANRVLAGQSDGLTNPPSVTFQVVDAVSGDLLMQQSVQPALSDSLTQSSDVMSFAFQIPAKRQIKLRIRPVGVLPDSLMAVVFHVYAAGDTSSASTAPSPTPTQHGVPLTFNLFPNYPNPFNPTTQISYAIATSSHVTLRIYDVLGREVAILVNGNQDAGYKTVDFDANGLPSGVYFYRLQAGQFSDVKKMLLMR